MRSACSGDDEYVVTRLSNVDLVSSISAHSSPGQSPSMRRAVSVSAPSPNVSASRLAGSMVTTTARLPRRAPSRASTAAVVVLPTPPVPQHTGQHLHLLGTEVGLEQERQAQLRQGQPLAQARELLGLERRPLPAELRGGGQRLGLARSQRRVRLLGRR